jgi:tRNA-specific 2-thiouridylase
MRHGAHKNSCTLTQDVAGKVVVKLAERDQGIAPGQYAVFYDGDVCLGGGIIGLLS